ncbi:MAG: aspartate kinase, partial [Flavobacteriales bacterium]|nr:aspartate kinase [Flavobacteriales bacterium]
MQNSAVSFSICVDNDPHKIPQLLKDFQQFYDVLYNVDLSLFTIRHYTDNYFDSFLHDKDVILEQKSRNTIQLIVR